MQRKYLKTNKALIDLLVGEVDGLWNQLLIERDSVLVFEWHLFADDAVTFEAKALPLLLYCAVYYYLLYCCRIARFYFSLDPNCQRNESFLNNYSAHVRKRRRREWCPAPRCRDSAHSTFDFNKVIQLKLKFTLVLCQYNIRAYL